MTEPLAAAAVHRAVGPLMNVSPRVGVRLTLVNIVVVNALLVTTFAAPGWPLFLALATLTGLFYCSVMMTTHDAIHHTLTGWYWFDEIVPRVFSYFVFWPHGLYSELHKMHHRMNGRDLADPEQPTPTVAAYRAASLTGRFLMRHQWQASLLVGGGVGMIVRHVRAGLRLWPRHPVIRRLMVTDALGIAAATAVTLTVIIAVGVTWRYAVYLLVVERVMGYCQQLRSHVEHYGLHGAQATLLETRLYNCRNVRTSRLVSRFFNGLNFHAVHHAFPAVPFYHLREAHTRLAALCAAAGRPLIEEDGYLRTLRRLAATPLLIDGAGPSRAPRSGREVA